LDERRALSLVLRVHVGHGHETPWQLSVWGSTLRPRSLPRPIAQARLPCPPVPSAKRERKKAGRLARQQAALDAQRRARLRTRIIAAVVLLGLVVSLAFVLSRGGKSKKAVKTTTAT